MILPFEAHDLRMKERLQILKRKVWLSPKEEKVFCKFVHVGELNPSHEQECLHYITIRMLLLNETKYFKSYS